MHLKISQLLTEDLRLFTTKLLGAMIPRPFCSYKLFVRRVSHMDAVHWI